MFFLDKKDIQKKYLKFNLLNKVNKSGISKNNSVGENSSTFDWLLFFGSYLIMSKNESIF
jgi:hypothetical protein